MIRRIELVDEPEPALRVRQRIAVPASGSRGIAASGAARCPPIASATTRACSRTVWLRKNRAQRDLDAEPLRQPRSDLQRLSDCPPSSKKLSVAPTRATPSTSDQISATA